MFDKSIFAEHVLLVTDMMTHVGKVVGLTHSGLRDFINAINVSAPMTHGLFKVVLQYKCLVWSIGYGFVITFQEVCILVAESCKTYPGCSHEREV